MTCKNCGIELKNDEMVCPNCGAQQVPFGMRKDVEYDTQSNQDEGEITPVVADDMIGDAETIKMYQERNKRKRNWIILLICMFVAVICVGALLYRWYNSPEKRFLRALKNGDYESIGSVLDEDRAIAESSIIIESLKIRIEDVQQAFKNKKSSYTEATNELNSIKNLSITDVETMLLDAFDYLNRINNSRTCFETAESFKEKNDYAKAIEQYQMVIEEDPDYSKAKTHLEESVNEFRNERLKAAEIAADAEEYQTAIDILQAALLVLPSDSKLTQQVIVYHNDMASKKKNELLALAEEMVQKKQFLEAITILDQYLIENPIDVEVKTARQKYYDQYITDTVAKASEEATKENYSSAIFMVQKALDVYPDDTILIQQLSEYQRLLSEKQKRELLDSAEELVQKKQFVAAIALLDQYVESHEADVDVNRVRQEYYDQYIESVITSADLLVSSGKYTEAFSEINTGLANAPDNQKLIAKKIEVKEAHIQQFLSDSQAKSSAGDYLSAIAILEEGLNFYYDEKRIISEIERNKEQYIGEVLMKADEKLKNEDYIGAEEIVKEGKKNYPEDERFTQKIDEIADCKPISFITMPAFNDGGFGSACYGKPRDPFDNDYAYDGDYFVLGIDGKDCNTDLYFETSEGRDADGVYKEVRLDGKYSKLTGVLAPGAKVTENGYGWIIVYSVEDGEKKMLYKSNAVNRKTEPFEISIDVSGVNYLKVYVYVVGKYGLRDWVWPYFEPSGSIILSNFMLHKVIN